MVEAPGRGALPRSESAAGVQPLGQCHQGKEMKIEAPAQWHEETGAIGQDDKLAVLSVAQRVPPAVLQSFQPASGKRGWTTRILMQARRSAERQAGGAAVRMNEGRRGWVGAAVTASLETLPTSVRIWRSVLRWRGTSQGLAVAAALQPRLAMHTEAHGRGMKQRARSCPERTRIHFV